MTEREHAQRLLARLPDSELEIVGGFLAWRDCLADIDEWGDLRALRWAGTADDRAQAQVPFGGTKGSGLGVHECGEAAFDFFSEERIVYVAG